MTSSSSLPTKYFTDNTFQIFLKGCIKQNELYTFSYEIFAAVFLDVQIKKFSILQ